MKKKFDALKMIRKIRNKRYEEWKKNPKAFEKLLMETADTQKEIKELG